MPRPVGTRSVCWQLLRRFVPGEHISVVLGLVVTLLASLLGLVQPWPLKLVLDFLVPVRAETTGPERRISSWVHELVPSVHSGEAFIGCLCLSLVLIELVRGALNVYGTYLLNSAGLRMVFKLRCALFDHLQKMPLAYHSRTSVSDSMYRVTWDSYCVQTVFNALVVNGITAAATLIGVLAFMLMCDWRITLATLAVAVPLAVIIGRFERPMTEHAMRVHEHESRLSSRVQETIGALRAVLAYTQERRESAAFRTSAGDALGANLKLIVIQTFSQSVVGVILAIGTGAVIWLSAARVSAGELSPGDLVLLVAYAAMVLKPLETLAYTVASLQSATAGGQRVFHILDALPEIRDLPHAVSLREVRGEISLCNLSFSYDGRTSALSGLTVDLAPGRAVALVGPSGAGKSTLINLLLRFYEPTEGVIKLDGGDLRSFTLKSVRENIALVTQDTLLFSATIQENIAYGRPDAATESIRQAATDAGIHDFIMTLPDGYNTPVTEGGVSLSTGQRQRISIARAFLKDAPILILDEPSSALDSETEETVTQAIRRLTAGRTTLIIAHRFSTIRFADEILVMEKGRIIQRGSYQELAATPGMFERLHSTQFGLMKEKAAT